MTCKGSRQYHREWKRRWRKNKKNREKERETQRAYYASHKDSTSFKQRKKRGRDKWRSSEENKKKERKSNSKRQKTARQQDPIGQYLKFIKRRYGLTAESFEGLLKQQQRKCKLCLKRKKLFVDHCHKTNVVRGLLCNSCNLMLGTYEKFTRDRHLLNRVTKHLNQ